MGSVAINALPTLDDASRRSLIEQGIYNVYAQSVSIEVLVQE